MIQLWSDVDVYTKAQNGATKHNSDVTEQILVEWRQYIVPKGNTFLKKGSHLQVVGELFHVLLRYVQKV